MKLKELDLETLKKVRKEWYESIMDCESEITHSYRIIKIKKETIKNLRQYIADANILIGEKEEQNETFS